MKKTNNKGFTLIELLIVIGIIAILAAAVIIAINPGRQFEQARNATRWSHMNSIVNAVYSYTISEGGTFPTCISGSEGSFVDASSCDGDLVSGDSGGYMSDIPQDPQVGSDTCSGYILKLEDNRVTIKPDDGLTAGTETTPEPVCTGGDVVSDDVSDLQVVQ